MGDAAREPFDRTRERADPAVPPHGPETLSQPPSVRSLSELAGRALRWRFDLGLQVPRTFDRPCVLFDAAVPVVNGRIMWERLKTLDFVMEPAEGVYEVHIDLRDPGHRPAVAWKAGATQSAAAFELVAEGSITARGWITTASSRRLAWEPTQDFGFEYVVFAPGGPRLITVSAAFEVGIGGNPGHMLIAPDEAADPELPALVALGFALACEQALRLHWDAPRTLRGT